MMSVPDNLYPYSTPEGIQRDLQELRASFKSGYIRGLNTRRHHLQQLHKMIREGHNELCEAVRMDLHKGEVEFELTELAIIESELQEHLDYLEDWMKPEKVSTNLSNLPGSSIIQRDPLGVVCVMDTWNYPVQLTLAPLVGAISAGNCVMVRLSGDDTTVHTNNALYRLLDEYMDKRVVRVVHGGVEVSKAMLEQRFDLIFCTGGTFIGKIVAAAAVKTLTPTILELGGKSPAIIDETCDRSQCASYRLGFFHQQRTNVFASRLRPCGLQDWRQVAALLEMSLRSFFGDDALHSEDYGRLVTHASSAVSPPWSTRTNATSLTEDPRMPRSSTSSQLSSTSRMISKPSPTPPPCRRRSLVLSCQSTTTSHWMTVSTSSFGRGRVPQEVLVRCL